MAPSDLFPPSVVAELAGPRAYVRGSSYHEAGLVEGMVVDAARVRATVRGSMPYIVELWSEQEEPEWSCSCPAAEDGSFCKHCVAVAMSLGASDAGHGSVAVSPAPEVTPAPSDEDLRAYLRSLPLERLVELVCEQAGRDWRLGERLRAEAAAASGDGLELELWRQRIDTAFAPYGDFVHYQEAAGWAREIDEMIDALQDLCDAGHPGAVATLAEHAHRRADEAVQHVDDSDGWLTTISERLSDLHLRACKEAKPDPVDLARRLVDLELTSELDGFHRAAATYADLLGETGLAEYRKAIEPRWQQLAGKPSSAPHRWSTERFRVHEALIGVALGSGDPDHLIDIYRDDLHTPDDYLEITRALTTASRPDDAIDWARKGLDAYPDRPWQTPPLREFLAQLLRDRGDTADAVDLFWDAFRTSPSLDAYRRLLDEAGDDTVTWRERSINTLQSRIAEDRPEDQTRRTSLVTTPKMALIEILMYEGRVGDAWDAATTHGCDDQRMWLTLARAREATHPSDAIDVYEPEVLAQIDRKKNDAYRTAVELMARIKRLAQTAEQPERFDDLLHRVRTQHKPKRNLQALLNAKRW